MTLSIPHKNLTTKVIGRARWKASWQVKSLTLAQAAVIWPMWQEQPRFQSIGRSEASLAGQVLSGMKRIHVLMGPKNNLGTTLRAFQSWTQLVIKSWWAFILLILPRLHPVQTICQGLHASVCRQSNGLKSSSTCTHMTTSTETSSSCIARSRSSWPWETYTQLLVTKSKLSTAKP